MPPLERKISWFWLVACLLAAGASFYAWDVTGSRGHFVAGVGFAVLGLAWSRRLVAWIGTALIVGGAVARWMG